MSVLLLVEGPSDQATLSAVARKILTDRERIRVLPSKGHGALRDPRRVSARIDEALRVDPGLRLVLVCLDSECTDPSQTRAEVAAVERAVRQSFGTAPGVHYVIVGHALESWIVADAVNVARHLNARTALSRPSPEESCRPKRVLVRWFRACSRTYNHVRDDVKLLADADLDVVATACPGFAEFRRLLEAPPAPR